MGEDITLANALFSMVQRIEDKLDHVKDDLGTVKTKQAEIEANFQDHIAESDKVIKTDSDISNAQKFILKYLIPISLALLMAGRFSVELVGNYKPQNHFPAKQNTEMSDSFYIRNDRFDSILKAKIKEQLKSGN